MGSVELLAGGSLLGAGAVLVGAGVSTGGCVSAAAGAAEGVELEVELPLDELDLLLLVLVLVLATVFGGLFVALLAGISCGGGTLTSATLGTRGSPAAFVLATVTGGDALGSVALEVGGTARGAAGAMGDVL